MKMTELRSGLGIRKMDMLVKEQKLDGSRNARRQGGGEQQHRGAGPQSKATRPKIARMSDGSTSMSPPRDISPAQGISPSDQY